jgi:hypothetical protein
MVHVARMGEMKTGRKHSCWKGRHHSEDLGVDGRIMLKFFLASLTFNLYTRIRSMFNRCHVIHNIC